MRQLVGERPLMRRGPLCLALSEDDLVAHRVGMRVNRAG